eukprot:10068096-Alexandrium_andersonii.AAC.1
MASPSARECVHPNSGSHSGKSVSQVSVEPCVSGTVEGTRGQEEDSCMGASPVLSAERGSSMDAE